MHLKDIPFKRYIWHPVIQFKVNYMSYSVHDDNTWIHINSPNTRSYVRKLMLFLKIIIHAILWTCACTLESVRGAWCVLRGACVYFYITKLVIFICLSMQTRSQMLTYSFIALYSHTNGAIVNMINENYGFLRNNKVWMISLNFHEWNLIK